MLPENQFGFVLSVDYLDYKPLNIINRYLVDIFRRLRPGGTFMFTYNNCNQVYGARNVENNFKCYTPGTEVINLAQQAGYKVSKHFDEFEHISWLELTKPGDLASLRGGQTLGEILSL
jgi:SAM-dependent methyltransferase